MWPFVVCEGFDPLRPVGRVGGILDRHSVLERAVVDLHEAKLDSARRIASEREIWFRSADASSAASSSPRWASAPRTWWPTPTYALRYATLIQWMPGWAVVDAVVRNRLGNGKTLASRSQYVCMLTFASP